MSNNNCYPCTTEARIETLAAQIKEAILDLEFETAEELLTKAQDVAQLRGEGSTRHTCH